MNLEQEKRVMLAFALSLVMLLLYRVYFFKEPPAEENKPAATAKAPTSQTGASKAAIPPPVTAPAAELPAETLPVVQGTKSEEIVVESKLYRVTFSTVGADVRSWVLKDYPQGEQIDTIDTHACTALGFPLNLDLENPALNSEVNQAIFLTKAYRGEAIPAGKEPEELAGNTFSPPVTLAFSYSNGKIQVTKRFSFGESYSVKTEISVSDGRHNLPVQVVWPGGFGDQSVPATMETLYEKGVYESLDDSKLREVTLSRSFFSRFFSGGSGSNANDLKQDVPALWFLQASKTDTLRASSCSAHPTPPRRFQKRFGRRRIGRVRKRTSPSPWQFASATRERSPSISGSLLHRRTWACCTRPTLRSIHLWTLASSVCLPSPCSSACAISTTTGYTITVGPSSC